MSSGRGPAVAIMHVDSLATNAARNVIEPLDDVGKALELQQEDFAEVVWKAGEYEGKRYGIPLDVHPLGFFYNKTLMQRAGLDPAKPPATADAVAAGRGRRAGHVRPDQAARLVTDRGGSALRQ